MRYLRKTYLPRSHSPTLRGKVYRVRFYICPHIYLQNFIAPRMFYLNFSNFTVLITDHIFQHTVAYNVRVKSCGQLLGTFPEDGLLHKAMWQTRAQYSCVTKPLYKSVVKTAETSIIILNKYGICFLID